MGNYLDGCDVRENVFSFGDEFMATVDAHDERERELEYNIRKLKDELMAHQKEHPLLDKEFLIGFVSAVCDRMVERDYLVDPVVEPFERGWADYAVSIRGALAGGREVKYEMCLTAASDRLSLMFATGSGVSYKHFHLPEIDLDEVIDHLPCKILPCKGKGSLEDKIKEAVASALPSSEELGVRSEECR